MKAKTTALSVVLVLAGAAGGFLCGRAVERADNPAHRDAYTAALRAQLEAAGVPASIILASLEGGSERDITAVMIAYRELCARAPAEAQRQRIDCRRIGALGRRVSHAVPSA